MRINGSMEDFNVKTLMDELRIKTLFVIVISSWAIPWFPTKENDLDFVASDCLYSGVSLDSGLLLLSLFYYCYRFSSRER
jgi:hypothetical protein